MCEQRDRTTPATAELSGHDRGAAGGPSRRRFLKSSAALATGAAAAPVLSRDAFAQAAGAVHAELARMQGAPRILLRARPFPPPHPPVAHLPPPDLLTPT